MEIIKHVDQSVLSEKMKIILENTKSDNTRRAYRSDFLQFTKWCEKNGLINIPSDETTLSLYIVSLNEMKYLPATIRRKLTSIAQAHKLSGHATPVTDRIKEIEKGIRRLNGTAQTKAKPITAKILSRLLNFCDNTLIGFRDKCLLLIGFCGAFRRSELVGINFEDIETVDEGIIISLKTSKTDQEGFGRRVAIPFCDKTVEMCPVRSLKNFIDISGINSGPIFRAIGRRKTINLQERLSTRSVSNIVKKYVSKAGLDSKKFSGHSLRSGFATSAATAGIEERLIMAQTGHKSISVMRGYVQEGEMFLNHPLEKILSY